MTNLCFIVLNYKQSDYVISCVKNILRIQPYSPVVIVDNNSNDGSYNKLYEEYKENLNVKVFRNTKNTGYAKGNNIGIKKAKEIFQPEFVAIMNPDVHIYDEALVPSIIKAFGKYPEMALCTGLMLDQKKNLDYRRVAWQIPDKLDDFILNIPVLSSWFNPLRYSEYRIQEDGLSFVEVVPGSFFVARLHHLDKMGLFDEGTFLYCEERILGVKAKRHGFKVGLITTAFYIHDHSHVENPSLTDRFIGYFRLIRSRFYYNTHYNSWSKEVVLSALCFSVLLGLPLVLAVWAVKKLLLFLTPEK